MGVSSRLADEGELLVAVVAKAERRMSLPRYVVIRDSLKEAIGSGKLKAGDAIFSERVLALRSRASRATVRKAISHLVREGLLVQLQGSGTFVSESSHRNDRIHSPPTSVMALGYKEMNSEWREQTLGPPSPEEIYALGIFDGAAVVRFVRVVLEGGSPIGIERTSTAASRLSSPLGFDMSILDQLKDSGACPTRSLARICAQLIQDPDASLLGVPVGTAGLLVERIGYLASGAPVAFSRTISPGHAGEFVVSLTA